MQHRKRRLCDRYDGYRIKKVDPLFQIIPIVMRSRIDSQVFFDDRIDITEIEKFIRLHRKTDMPELSFLHIIMAACVRIISQRPRLNRFVSGKKIYARNCIRLSIAVKKNLSIDGVETTIMPEFDPEDTLYDVVYKFNKVLKEQGLKSENDNSTDVVAKTLGACPTALKSAIVSLMRHLDNHGLMPKAINKASPFHSSMFITDVGSIGIGPIHHHLYEFGTCSSFIAVGKKETSLSLNSDGQVEVKKHINLKVVADERICDGYYYAAAMKMFRRYIKNPDRLLSPPDKVYEDDCIDK